MNIKDLPIDEDSYNIGVLAMILFLEYVNDKDLRKALKLMYTGLTEEMGEKFSNEQLEDIMSELIKKNAEGYEELGSSAKAKLDKLLKFKSEK